MQGHVMTYPPTQPTQDTWHFADEERLVQSTSVVVNSSKNDATPSQVCGLFLFFASILALTSSLTMSAFPYATHETVHLPIFLLSMQLLNSLYRVKKPNK